MLPLINRITKSNDFSLVVNSRIKNYQPALAIFLKPTDQPSRLGLIISRRVGNAVKRHLLARQLREIFKNFLKEHPTGFDVVVKFSTKFKNPSFTEIETQFKLGIKQILESNIVEN
jgi:ribonuclease P protein component